MCGRPRAAGRRAEQHEVPSPETGLYFNEVQLLPPAPDSTCRRCCSSKATSSLVVFTNGNGLRSQAAVRVKRSHSGLSRAAVGGWTLHTLARPPACSPTNPLAFPTAAIRLHQGGHSSAPCAGGARWQLSTLEEALTGYQSRSGSPAKRLGRTGAIFWQNGLVQTLPASHKPHSALPKRSS